MKTAAAFLMLACLTTAFVSVTSFTAFWQDFYVNFGKQNTRFVGDEVQLGLTTQSGSGFQSKYPYLFGYIAMKLKLVSGNSAGVVTSYYLSSTYPKHCEMDFEFLGNVTGQPYILQTNVFVNGIGDREQRITLWFDPAKEFHTYGLLWNKALVLFFVDDIAIRVFKNAQHLGVPFLNYQEMYSYSSTWDGSSWATRGGRDKADWTQAPFVSSYTDFDIEACRVVNNTVPAKNVCYRELYVQPYGSKANQTLTSKQWSDLKWIQNKWLTYDYCTDTSRWTKQPAECAINWPPAWTVPSSY